MNAEEEGEEDGAAAATPTSVASATANQAFNLDSFSLQTISHTFCSSLSPVSPHPPPPSPALRYN